jgi:hypothetical protein
MDRNTRFILCFAAVQGRALHNKEIQKAYLQFDPTAKEGEVGQILHSLKQEDLVAPLGDGAWIITFDGSVEVARMTAGGVK